MTYFVLVYDRLAGQIVVGPEPFDADHRRAAMQRRFDLEAEWRSLSSVEFVVLGAESEEQIRHTHGRYFKTVAELAS
jgi:hypothetical protein